MVSTHNRLVFRVGSDTVFNGISDILQVRAVQATYVNAAILQEVDMVLVSQKPHLHRCVEKI